jgi:hypothetical protein
MIFRLRKLLLIAAALLLSWGVVVALTGGIDTRILGIAVRSRDPFRALVGGVILLLIHAAVYREESARDLERVRAFARTAAPLIGALLAVAIAVHGVALGTFTAGGSDAYGYVSQAYGWASGSLPGEIPLTIELPFDVSDPMQAPLGYRVGQHPHTMVPTYPPGLPLMMAAALIAGQCGPFFVVPLCGALFIWWTYRLGERAGGRVTGAIAALVAATSPVVLYQNLVPMSDVPAGAFWTGALLFAYGTRWRDTTAAGLCAAIGLLIRPNLLPLAVVPLLEVILANRAQLWRRGLVFGAPLIPVAAAMAALNTYYFGAPSNSGYGAASELYAWRDVWPNVKLYSGWLLESESWGVLVAALPLAGALARGIDRALIRGCVLMLLVTFACYVSYFQWDVWWYLRFLLPGWGALAVLVAAGFTSIARSIRRPYGQAIAAAGLALFVAARVSFGEDRGSFGSEREGERRYIDVGGFVEANLPPNAAIFSMQHSGGIRFYSGRLTLRYDWVEKEWAKDVAAAVERAGYHPFLVIDDWEKPSVADQWGLPRDRPLPWPVVGRMTQFTGVTVYDLATNAQPAGPVEIPVGRGRWCEAMHPLHR